MATPPISREEAERRVAAVNECLRRGFRPPGHVGKGPGALTQAAIDLGLNRNSTTMRVFETIKAIYAIQPNWWLYRPTVASPPVSKAAPQQVVAPEPLNVPPPPPPTLLERLKKGPVNDGYDDEDVHLLRRQGHNVHERAGVLTLEKDVQPAFIGGPVFEYVSRKDNTFHFGATSDNHLGSKYERLDVLNSLYDTFAKEGVDRVFNAGNWIDGEARFNKFDLHTHGMDNQLAYLAAEYPQRKGLVTYAVAGDDHEGWYGQREGVDIGKYAEHVMTQAGRTDWVNLGYMEAHVKLVNANTGKWTMLAVVHPGGGSAYALSYSIQKIIESLDGGEKPAVGLYGHYHKLWAGNIRNVWCLQTGCFTANTRIETTAGRVSIKNIKLGDEVVTHLGRPRKVTRLYERLHYGDMVSLNYGRVGRFDQTLTATPEHPVLTETAEGRKEWKEISEIRVGDVVFVKSRPCSVTGEPIPYWMKMSRNANPMDLAEVRDKLSAAKGKKVWTRGGSDGDVHLQRDILPFCATMEAEGWRMIPVGASQIPDAIGIKDGKVVAFEVERSRGRLLEHKKAKYEGSALGAKVDEVRWVPLTERLIQPRSWYEYDEETTMCKVAVVGVKRSKPTRPTRVYNFEVEGDNSYVAGNVAVHNCTEDQTPFMRKKKLEAHVGGSLVKLTQDPETGAITRFQPELMRFFNRGFYNHRWSHGSQPVMPHRSV